MRLFIAIPLPPDIRREAELIERQLQHICQDGRFVPADNFHITLQFLGETNHLAEAITALSQSVRDIRPFILRLSGYHCFEHGKSKTGFLEVGGDLDELNRLHESLVSALFEQGLPVTRRRLTPHITLGRNVAHAPLTEEQKSRLQSHAAFTVTQIILFESQRKNGSMVYTPLHKEVL